MGKILLLKLMRSMFFGGLFGRIGIGGLVGGFFFSDLNVLVCDVIESRGGIVIGFSKFVG